MKRDKKESEDLSQPTAHDLSSPPEATTLAWDDEAKAVKMVYGAAVPMPSEPAPVADDRPKPPPPPPFSREAVLALLDELCKLCNSGWTIQLADLRDLKGKVEKMT